MAGKRLVEPTQRRTAVDFALLLRRVLDGLYPDAERVVLGTGNLNTHRPGSLYEAFGPEEARRLAARVERHHTPKHGSWLNVAGCELSALARQCPDRRIPDLDALKREVAAWQEARDAAVARIDWQSTTADARVELERLYPSIQLQ